MVYADEDPRTTYGASIGKSQGFGNVVVVQATSGEFLFYAHLEKIDEGISAGTTVKTGDVLGPMGNTGQSGGAHLHLEIISSVDKSMFEPKESKST